MEEERIRYLYVNAMCPKDGYFCGMPIQYEMEEDGRYHKKKCVCYHIRRGETPCPDCKHIEVAPEIPNKNAYLRDNLL